MQALDEVRRRVQQAIHGHRGRKGDPLYGIRTILRLGLEHLSETQQARLDAAFAANPRHDEVAIAWQAIHQLRSAYTAESWPPARGLPWPFSRPSPSARSRRSPASAAPCAGGVESSSPTSRQAAPATAAPRPSTA